MDGNKFSINLAIHRLCRRNGISINKFSQQSGINKGTVAYIMKTDSPRLDTCERFAAAFGLPLDQFIREGYPQTKSVIALPKLAHCGERAHQSHVDYTEGYNDRAAVDRETLIGLGYKAEFIK